MSKWADLLQSLLASQPREQRMSAQWLNANDGHERRRSRFAALLQRYQDKRRASGKVIATDIEVDNAAD